jgi:peptidoglycan hydrolase-like protein with peptidoglycan-binding domain
MSNFDHEGEAFAIDRSFEFSVGSTTPEQREFDAWLRRIGGSVGGSESEVLVAKKGIGAALQRIVPKVKRAAAKAGMPPEKVCWIQNVLNKANGEALGEDGIYGPLSRAAVQRFQGAHGLAVDGIVGPRTEAALIQAALNQIAQASLVPINGVMDPQTSQQVKNFQAANGLAADGIVGPKTRAAMVTALGGRCLARPSGGQGPGTQWYQVKPRPGCDQRKFDLLTERCRNEAIEAGINCLTKFGLGVADAAKIVAPFVTIAAGTSVAVPPIAAIAAAIAVFAGAFLTTTQILEAAGCVENVIKNMLSCQEAARFNSGC